MTTNSRSYQAGLEIGRAADTIAPAPEARNAADVLRQGNGATAIGSRAGDIASRDAINDQIIKMLGLNHFDVSTKPESKIDIKLPDGSQLQREADRDVVTRPDGTKVVLTADGPQFFDKDGQPMPLDLDNAKFSGSGMHTPDGTHVDGYFFSEFTGSGTIKFPNGDTLEISNERVVVPRKHVYDGLIQEFPRR